MGEVIEMTAEEFIEKLNECRNKIVAANNIKYPEYDPYINGWDDCIEVIEDHIADLASCC